MTDTASEAWRAVCEARHWLRKGYTTSDRVGALMARVATQRGAQSADQLRDEMRRQWSRRREWMQELAE